MTYSWQHRLRHVLVPNPYQLLFCTLVVVLGIALGTWRVPATAIAHWGGLDFSALSGGYQHHLEVLGHVPVIGKLGVIVFWGLVGAIAYILLWLMQAAYSEVHNEMVVTHQYRNIGDPELYHIRLLLKGAAAAIWAALALISIAIIVPWALPYLSVGVAPHASPEDIRKAVEVTIALILNSYILLASAQGVIAL